MALAAADNMPFRPMSVTGYGPSLMGYECFSLVYPLATQRDETFSYYLSPREALWHDYCKPGRQWHYPNIWFPITHSLIASLSVDMLTPAMAGKRERSGRERQRGITAADERVGKQKDLCHLHWGRQICCFVQFWIHWWNGAIATLPFPRDLTITECVCRRLIRILHKSISQFC